MAKAKRGRPPIEVNIVQVEQLAAQGLTMAQIAAALGIGETTLYEKRIDYPHITEAIKRGQAKGIATITNSMFNSAKNGNITAGIFYLKNRAGWRDKPPEDMDDTVREFKITLTHEADSPTD